MMNELNSISSEEVKNKLEAEETLYIIDVREDFEIANGKIPGAVHIPMNTVPENLEVFDEAISYIIVCAAGVRSEYVADYLQSNGLKAISMDGGMYSWTGLLE